MKCTALIMAGGKGERFWPRSRVDLPKQFLPLVDDEKTMIQMTVERILPLVSMEDIYIATNQRYEGLVREQLPDIPAENILCEPVGRNTAPCVGLGAVHMRKKYGDAIMMVLASDSLIKYNDIFLSTLRKACSIAEKDENLVTLGITPNYPETGYGYIRFLPDEKEGSAFRVDRFVEKPSLELAKEYLSSGQYLWNSGMFIWKVSSVLSNIHSHMPDIYEGLVRIEEAIGTGSQEEVLVREFTAFRSESVDYGIMEKAKDIYVLPGTFGWDDVGSWLAVGRLKKSNEDGNVIKGNVVTVDCAGCVMEGKGKLIAAIGLEDIVVVDTEDATLICDKRETGQIKKVLEKLRALGMNQYL